jgi:hypothetical protein
MDFLKIKRIFLKSNGFYKTLMDFFKTLMDFLKLKTVAQLQGSLAKTGHAENCLEKTRQSC